ncbi:MAG: hypothetical protein Kow0077_29150 [Anaerolineae bacterium]
MRVDVALSTIHRLYVETAPLIYYIELHSRYLPIMDIVVAAIDSASIQAESSVITLVEVLSHPLQQGNLQLANDYRNILVHSGAFQIIPVTVDIAEQAARLRARYNLRTPDALHIATALERGCDAILTNDVAFKRVEELQVLLLDNLENPTSA